MIIQHRHDIWYDYSSHWQYKMKLNHNERWSNAIIIFKYNYESSNAFDWWTHQIWIEIGIEWCWLMTSKKKRCHPRIQNMKSSSNGYQQIMQKSPSNKSQEYDIENLSVVIRRQGDVRWDVSLLFIFDPWINNEQINWSK